MITWLSTSSDPSQHPKSGWRIAGNIILIFIIIGILAFARQVFDYYRSIKRGDINPVFDRAFGSSGSQREVSKNVTKSDLLLLTSSEAPSIGKADAPITIVEFLDYGCPFCKQSFESVRKLVTERPDEVRLIVRDFPIELLHPGANKAAMAARCVQAIDQSKFWSFHDKLFIHQIFDDAMLERLARESGVSVDEFKSCLATERTRSLVEKDIALGLQTGVQGTPTFFINGRRIQGALDSEAFDAIINWLQKQP